MCPHLGKKTRSDYSVSAERLRGLDRPGEAWGAHRKGLSSPLQHEEQSYGAGRQAPRKRKEDKWAIVLEKIIFQTQGRAVGDLSRSLWSFILCVLTNPHSMQGVLLLRSKSGSFARKQRTGQVAYSLQVTLQTYEAAITEWTLFGS